MAQPSAPFDHTVRLIGIFATGWRFGDYAPHPEPDFELGWLKEFYPLFRDQLPQVLIHQQPSPATIALTTPSGPKPTINTVDIWLFALPSDQVVAALALSCQVPDLNRDPAPTVRIMEPLGYGELSIDNVSWAQHIAMMAVASGAAPIKGDEAALPPERHQIVFAPEAGEHDIPGDDIVNRILYRIDPPFRAEFLKVDYPPGLNQGEHSLCAVTPYVSLLYGHEVYIENSVFLTTVQAVGTAARFRQIWRTAYRDVRTFRASVQSRDVGKQRRGDLEELVDRLGNLELDLSFSVETSADLGLLVPSLRIESFHGALYQAMEIPNRAKTVSQMFTRLDSSIDSELKAIDIRERLEKDEKLLAYAIAASVLGFVVAPMGFLMAFFGINATQVSNRYSIFDWDQYRLAYGVAAIIALVPIVVFFVLFGRRLVRVRQDRRKARRLAARLASRA